MFKLLSFLLKTISYQVAFRKAKKKGILFYLKALQGVRQSLLFALILFFTFQIMVLGFIGAVVSGVWLLPIEDTGVRLWILFSVFAVLFLIPLTALIIVFSEKTWLKLSGAHELIKDI